MMTAVPRSRRGFTLLEIMVVSFLTALLAMLLCSVWFWIGKAGFPHDAIIRSRLIQEMDLAVASLSRDLCGSLAVPSSLEDITQGRWIGWQHPGNDELWLCYDGGANPDGMADWSETSDAVVRYYLAADPAASVTTKILIREDRNAGTSFTVARHVDSMSVESDAVSGSEFVQIQLTFKYLRPDAEYTRTFTLNARAPQ